MNDLTITQLSTILNDIREQATGIKAMAPVTTSEFVAVGQATLLAGYDNVLNAISQVLSRTLFSIRPYTRKFRELEVSNIRYGNHVRKLNIIDKPYEDSEYIPLTTAPDQFSLNKPDVIQFNWYGQKTYRKKLTVFTSQLDTAFSSPNEFSAFISMCMNNISDMMEQAREFQARATIANFIAGKTIADPDSVFHLLTEYNTLTGQTLTATTVYLPENFNAFMRWMHARIASISSLMTERTTKFHVNVTNLAGQDKTIMRHTPMNKQKVYTFADMRYMSESMVLADAYHDNYLRYADHDTVNFWQSFDMRDSIQVTPVYLTDAGTLETAAAPVQVDNVIGVIFDEEAMGYTLIEQKNTTSPFNAAGEYYNMFWRETNRYWNDFTENGAVLLLD